MAEGPEMQMKKNYQCLPANTDEDQTYDLPFSRAFIDSHPDLSLGLTYVAIPGGCINGTSVTYPENATITVLEKRRRLDLPQAREGNITILVVRARELNRNPSMSLNALSDKIFHRANLSLASQMSACSVGKLNIQMAQGPGIVNGVLDVQLNYRVSGIATSVVEQQLIQEVNRYGGENAFNHVMYCFPKGTLFGTSAQWAAYALIDHPRSAYNEDWCGYLSPHAHEFGHNLGLQHSGQYGGEYGDTTGLMGFATKDANGPKSCFNAHHHWELGWYDERSIDLGHTIRESAWSGRLMAFVDFDVTPLGEVVIIRAGNLYMQYNRQRSFNVGTRELRDRVVIVSAKDARSISNLEAGVAIGFHAYGTQPSFVYPNFDDTGFNLVIQVCNQVYGPPDYVHISIHLDDGIQSSLCGLTLSPPTSPPSVALATSVQPTNAPTPKPSAPPSKAPTPSPTVPPSKTPTQSPTSSPAPSTSPTTSPAPTVMCRDQEGLIPVSSALGRRTCAWIAARKVWKDFLCQDGYEAHEQCKVTCNSCDAPKPVTRPLDEVPLICEDSNKIFFMNEQLGSGRCSSLARNPGWRSRLCVPEEVAYHMCPETCGKCTDDCKDKPGRIFLVNQKRGYKDCAWLAARPMWQPLLCKPGHRAYEDCSESCNSCDR